MGGEATEGLGSGDIVSVDQLGARICALATRLAQSTYHWLEMIAEFDARDGWVGAGIRSCAHWLAWTCSMSAGTAREHVRVARQLTSLPLVSAEMAAGRLSYSKVREITRVADRVDEAQLVELARTATASQLARAVRGFRRADGDRATQEQRREARWWTDDDGCVVLAARLPAEDGAAVIAALEAARDDLARAGDSGVAAGATPADRADMLLQWARGYLATAPEDRSGEDRTTVVVHVGAEQLADNGRPAADVNAAVPTDCCEIAGVGGITRRTAARLACDAVVIGIVRGAGGAVLAHGRRRRTVSAAQRRALAIRDGHCQFPSCTRTTHLEAHHVRHWVCGGRTDMTNLLLLCRFHHMACHEDGVVISARADAPRGTPSWRFTTRDGEPFLGDRSEHGMPGWKDSEWLLWHGLDGSAGWDDPEANRIRPLWAGERFSLADTVSMLFANPRRRPAEAPDQGTDVGDQIAA